MTVRIAQSTTGGLARLSRRACLPLFAAAVLSPLAAARAQAWQIYRRTDLGFEVEMPGTPALHEDVDFDWRSVDARVSFSGTEFGANWQRFSPATTIEQWSQAQRIAAQTLGAPLVRESAFSMDGIPGREYAVQAERSNYASIMRAVFAGSTVTNVMVVGAHGLGDNPAVRRFLGSFRLLPSAR